MFLPMSCTSPLTVAISDLAALRSPRPGPGLFLLHEGLQVGDRLLHHARALDDLRQEHLAGAEQVADDVHAVHQRPFDDVERLVGLLARLLGVGVDEVDDALHERVRQPLLDGAVAPGVLPLPLAAGAVPLNFVGEGDEALGGVGAAVEQDVLDELEQVLGNLFVDAELPGVDDAHVQAGLDGVVEKRRVHRLAHGVVAAERERDVAETPPLTLRAGERGLDDPRGLDEIDGVVVVLLDAGGDGEDVGVEDDVGRVEADFIDKDLVSP